jgi:hypothetical protein
VDTRNLFNQVIFTEGIFQELSLISGITKPLNAGTVNALKEEDLYLLTGERNLFFHGRYAIAP